MKTIHYEMIRYVIGGICTTLVNLGVFHTLRYYIGFEMQTANISSIIIAIIFAFLINKKFVFHAETKETIWKEFFRFTGMRGLSLCTEVLGMQLFSLTSVSDMTAKILLQIIVIGMNYIISKYYVFKKQEDN